MSVTQLYCEGSKQGTDIRVISQLVPCLVSAVGSKNTLKGKVMADRRIVPNLACLVDRDFDCASSTMTQQPIDLFENSIQVGWSWERKEIENYLLDPTVVEQTWLSKGWFSLEDYHQALIQAVERLRFYTAARTTLSCFGFRNRWGSNVNSFSAAYKFPNSLDEQSCRDKITEIVTDGKGDRLITPGNVLQKFEELLSEFTPSGHRYNHFLIYFSGKDLLCAMKPSLDSWLPNPQKSIQTFAERIVVQLERAETPWTWLPEWQALRQLLE